MSYKTFQRHGAPTLYKASGILPSLIDCLCISCNHPTKSTSSSITLFPLQCTPLPVEKQTITFHSDRIPSSLPRFRSSATPKRQHSRNLDRRHTTRGEQYPTASPFGPIRKYHKLRAATETDRELKRSRGTAIEACYQFCLDHSKTQATFEITSTESSHVPHTYRNPSPTQPTLSA